MDVRIFGDKIYEGRRKKKKKKFSVEARPPFGATDVQSGSQVRCLPPRQPSRYGRERDDVETHGALPQRF